MDYHGRSGKVAASASSLHQHLTRRVVPTSRCTSDCSNDGNDTRMHSRTCTPLNVRAPASRETLDSDAKGTMKRNFRHHSSTGGQLLPAKTSVDSIDRLYSYFSGSDDDDDDDDDDDEDEHEQIKQQQRFLCYQLQKSHHHSENCEDLSDSVQAKKKCAVELSSDSETDRQCRFVGRLQPSFASKDPTRPCDAIYSRIGKKTVAAALPMAVISLPRLDQDYVQDEKSKRHGVLSPHLPVKSGLEASPHYADLKELREPQKMSYDSNFLHRGPVESCSNLFYSVIKSHAGAFSHSGQPLQSAVAPSVLCRGVPRSFTSLHQNEWRSCQHASEANELICRPLAISPTSVLTAKNGEDKVNTDSSGQIWVQQSAEQMPASVVDGSLDMHEQFYSAFNPTNMTLHSVPFMPMQTAFRSYSGLGDLEQRMMKQLRHHCTWKCTALIFVVVSLILVLLLSCLIVVKIHNVLWNMEPLRENYRDSSNDAKLLRSPVMAITFGKDHEAVVRQQSFSRMQFSLDESSFIKFNISLPSTALLGVYGSRDARPSHVRYELFFAFHGMELLLLLPPPLKLQRQQRSANLSQSRMVNSTFVHFFDKGLWYLFIYNDGDQSHNVIFSVSPLDSSVLKLCPNSCYHRGDCLDGQCHCFPGYSGSQCELYVCPVLCRGNGVYTGGGCQCHSGWKGKECELPTRECDDHFCGGSGHCVGGYCACTVGYTGTNCSEVLCDDESCVHGNCVHQKCLCESGWSGDHCDLVSCDPRCGLHGVCDNGTCVCDKGWNGKHCSLDGCPDMCSGHGRCQLQNSVWQCVCGRGWKASSCNLAMEVECESNRDEDEDGLVDCLDPDCCVSSSCQGSLQCRTAPDPLEILLRKQPAPTTSSFYDRVKFLVEEHGVQSYATLNSFSPSHVSVVRGQVMSVDGSPLMSVRVGVFGQPLYGFTFTRAMGIFDIVVNGGGSVTLNFQRPPFKVKQVTILIPWNRIVTMDTVTLMLENESEPAVEPCPSGTHDHYAMKALVLPTWQYMQLMPCPSTSSVIIQELKVLQESVRIPGTDMFLLYHSNRAPGYKSMVTVKLTPSDIPMHLFAIHLRITIEGLVFEHLFEADPSLEYHFVWDRKNAYNQKVYGIVTANFAIGYQYFNCNTIFWVKKTATLSGHDVSSSGIGGWNLNIHHHYNVQEGILHKGDGSNVYLKEQPWKFTTITGDGKRRSMDCAECENGRESSRLLAPVALASGRDGSLYVGDYNFIRKISGGREELLNILQLSMPEVPYKYFMTVSPLDGKLYISDHHGLRILRVKTMGSVRDLSQNFEVIAGTGDQCMPGDLEMCGDGGLAIHSRLHYPKGIAISKEGVVYFADGANIRMINQSGIISTMIGSQGPLHYWNPLQCHSAVPIQNVTLHWPTSVAISPLDDALHILDGIQVLKVTPDGMIVVVAGQSPHCPPAEESRNDTFVSSLASRAILQSPQHISFGTNGNLFIIEANGKDLSRILAVDTNEQIKHYAGTRPVCKCTNPRCHCHHQDFKQRTMLNNPTAITATPDGVLYIADMGGLRIYSVLPSLPPITRHGHYEIPSPLTKELYCFNRHGQHVATKSLVTGSYSYNFTYNVNSYYAKLVKISDDSGNSLILRRDYKLVEMQLPGGQWCRLTVDNLGNLLTFTDYENITTKFTYYANSGLLDSKEMSGGQVYFYGYDKHGQLLKALLPSGKVVEIGSDSSESGAIDQLKTYMSDDYFTINTPLKVSITMTRNLMPLYSLPQQFVLRNELVSSSLEWCYHFHISSNEFLPPDWIETRSGGGLLSSGGGATKNPFTEKDLSFRTVSELSDDTNRNSWRYKGKDIVVNENVVLSLRYNLAELTQTVLNRRREEILIIKYGTGGQPVQILPKSPAIGVNLTYNRLGQLIKWQSGDCSIAHVYDNKTGFLLEKKFANKASFRYAFHRVGNKPTEIMLPSGKKYHIQYDARGNLKAITMPSQVTHSFYSLTTIGYQRLVYVLPDSIGLYIQDYNAAGLVEEINFPSENRKITYKYDVNYRLRTVFHEWTMVKYVYYQNTELLIGLIIEDLLQEYSCEIQYGLNDSLVVTQYVFFNRSANDLINVEYRYTYGDNFAVSSQKVLVGDREAQTNSFVYSNETGRLQKMSPFSFSYPLTYREITIDNNVEIVREFDRSGRPTDVWYRFNNYVVFHLEVKYDSVGRVHQWRRKVRISDLKAYEYVFDIDGHLVEVLENSQSTWKYEYDNNGNIAKIWHYNNVHDIVIGPMDRVESFDEELLVFDVDGFLVKRGGEVFEFDSTGHPRRAFQPEVYDVHYFFDGHGRVIGRKETTKGSFVQLFYANLLNKHQVTHVYDHSTGATTQFFYNDRGKMFAMSVSGDYYYIGLDPNDSPILVMNSVGSVVKQMAYDPLGLLISDSAPSFLLIFGFRGRVADMVTKLAFMEDCVYDMQLGRCMFPSYRRLLEQVKNLPSRPELVNLYWYPFYSLPEVKAGTAAKDISDWMWKLGYNYDILVPGINFQGLVHAKHLNVATAKADSELYQITSSFQCAFNRDIANFRELFIVPKSALTISGAELVTLGHEFTKMRFLFGAGIVLSTSKNGQVSINTLGSVSEATASLVAVLFNESIVIGRQYTGHGRVVYQFVKPSVVSSVERMQQLLEIADESLPDINVTFHPVHVALDVVKFIDIRVISNHTTINIRHGVPVDSERERVARHAIKRAVDAAWEIEHERVQNKKITVNKWTKAQKEELVSKGRVQGMVGEYIHEISNYPELSDCPQNIRFVPVNR